MSADTLDLALDFNVLEDTDPSVYLPRPRKTFSESEWLDCYLKWFRHFRGMQPVLQSEVYWRENKQNNDWANSMTEATLVPYWIGFFGAKSLPHYHRRIKVLRKENGID